MIDLNNKHTIWQFLLDYAKKHKLLLMQRGNNHAYIPHLTNWTPSAFKVEEWYFINPVEYMEHRRELHNKAIADVRAEINKSEQKIETLNKEYNERLKLIEDYACEE